MRDGAISSPRDEATFWARVSPPSPPPQPPPHPLQPSSPQQPWRVCSPGRLSSLPLRPWPLYRRRRRPVPQQPAPPWPSPRQPPPPPPPSLRRPSSAAAAFAAAAAAFSSAAFFSAAAFAAAAAFSSAAFFSAAAFAAAAAFSSAAFFSAAAFAAAAAFSSAAFFSAAAFRRRGGLLFRGLFFLRLRLRVLVGALPGGRRRRLRLLLLLGRGAGGVLDERLHLVLRLYGSAGELEPAPLVANLAGDFLLAVRPSWVGGAPRASRAPRAACTDGSSARACRSGPRSRRAKLPVFCRFDRVPGTKAFARSVSVQAVKKRKKKRRDRDRRTSDKVGRPKKKPFRTSNCTSAASSSSCASSAVAFLKYALSQSGLSSMHRSASDRAWLTFESFRNEALRLL